MAEDTLLQPRHLGKHITRVSIAEAIKPKAGLCDVLHNRWWVVTPENEIMFFRHSSAQCNSTESIAKSIRDRLYPECDVIQLEWVFRPCSPYEFV